MSGSQTRRAILVIAGALVLVTIIGIVLSRVQPTEVPTPTVFAPEEGVIDLIEPPSLDGTPAPGSGENARGWIQITGEDGRLAQQYRCDRLDPSPEGYDDPGWLRMERPQLEVYQDGGGVIVITGDEALAYAPNSAIESGSITGDVVIRAYEDAAGRDASAPQVGLQLELRTHEARVNGVLGEVVCPDGIIIEAPEAVFVGRDLRLLLGDGDHVVSSLTVREIDHVRLVDPARRPARATSARRLAPSPATQPTRGARVRLASFGQATPQDSASAPRPGAAEPAPVWYRAIFLDDVRIVRGEADEAVDATADELHLVFSEDSDGAGWSDGDAAARSADDQSAAAFAPAPTGPLPPRAMLLAAAMALPPATELTFAPPPHPTDTVVTCTGGLRMRPMVDADARPASPRHARLELRSREGRPDVALTDRGSNIVARARLASYVTPDGRIALDGGPNGGDVHVSGPEFDLRGPRLHFSGADGTGGVRGAGRLWFAPEPSEDDIADDARSVEVTWTDAVDLTFADDATAADPASPISPTGAPIPAAAGRADGEGGEPGAPAPASDGPLGALDISDLERARFRGDVRIVAASGAATTARDVRTTAAGDGTGPAWIDADLAAADTIRFRADDLDLSFAANAAGTTSPRRVVGRGMVVARLDDRRIAADGIDATLAEERVIALDETVPATDATRIALERATANGNVDVRFEGGRRALADVMSFVSAGGVATLTGTDVQLHDPDAVLDGARRLVIEEAADRATVTGPGRVRRFAARRAASLAGTAETGGALATAERTLDSDTPRDVELTLTWTDGLTINPALDDTRSIEVLGDVEAEAGEAGFRGARRLVAELDLDAPPPATEPESEPGDPAAGDRPEGPRLDGRLRRIIADGRVVAFDRASDRELAADTIDLTLADGADGDPRPARLVAGGTVAMSGPGRRFWADDLTVDFADPKAAETGPARSSGSASAGDDATDSLAGADVEHIDATGDVEIRLADGRRVLGDRLEAAALDGDARLTGNLLIAGPDLLLTGPRAVQVRRNGDQVDIEGGGRFRQLDTPIRLAGGDTRSDARTIRETVAAVDPSLDVSWQTSAAWTRLAPAGARSSGAARLVLVGRVDAVAEPDRRERSTLQAERLELTFRDAPGTDAPTTAGNAESDTAPDAAPDAAPDEDRMLGGRRELERMVARGAARLRTYAWLREDRADLARLLAITAEDIDWDQRRGEATIDVPGELLIRDLREDADGAAPTEGDGMDFGPRGDTKFNWSRSLRMRPGGGRTTDITLDGSVRVIHRGLDGRLATLDAGTVVATVDRIVGPGTMSSPSQPGPGPAATSDDPATLAFGGPVDLRRLTARDRVRVDVAPRDVACESFTYDPATGIARMTSRPGSAISIEDTSSNGDPMRINGAAIWDLRRDTITVDGASGRGGR